MFNLLRSFTRDSYFHPSLLNQGFPFWPDGINGFRHLVFSVRPEITRIRKFAQPLLHGIDVAFGKYICWICVVVSQRQMAHLPRMRSSRLVSFAFITAQGVWW